MKRVLIIGCPGAGKSTFARALRDRTGLPLFYLDRIWHRPDRTTLTRPELIRQLSALMKQDRWILDGNYLHTLELRLRACDTVFLLDYPLSVCLEGAASRVGRPREDLPWVEPSLDPEFRRYIEAFPAEQLPQIYTLLRKFEGEKTIVIFHSRAEADAWLSRCL